MAEADDVKMKIRVILSQAEPAAAIYKLRDSTMHGFKPTTGDGPPFVVTNPSHVEMIHEQVNLLRVLYGQSSAESKEQFPALLWAETTEKNAKVVVQALIQTGQVSEIVRKLAEPIEPSNVRVRTAVWNTVRVTLAMEPQQFKDDELTRLEEIAKRDGQWASASERLAAKRRLSSLPPTF